jgi:hypothetical protein
MPTPEGSRAQKQGNAETGTLESTTPTIRGSLRRVAHDETGMANRRPATRGSRPHSSSSAYSKV